MPRRSHKVKFFVGLIFSNALLLPEVKRALIRCFGPVDFESPALNFTHTDYYEEEMGGGLKRAFLAFRRPRDLKNIFLAKLRTNALERRFAKEGRRRINLDPGYLDLSKVVLFSTKDFSHRIYLDRGIFAEATLFYKDRHYTPWPWTYPDYKSEGYIRLFEAIRDIYKAQR